MLNRDNRVLPPKKMKHSMGRKGSFWGEQWTARVVLLSAKPSSMTGIPTTGTLAPMFNIRTDSKFTNDRGVRAVGYQ